MTSQRIDSKKHRTRRALSPCETSGKSLVSVRHRAEKRGSKAIPGVELDQDGNIVAYDIEAQCRSVFENVRLILEEAGSHWDNLVDVTVFLTNMERIFRLTTGSTRNTSGPISPAGPPSKCRGCRPPSRSS